MRVISGSDALTEAKRNAGTRNTTNWYCDRKEENNWIIRDCTDPTEESYVALVCVDHGRVTYSYGESY